MARTLYMDMDFPAVSTEDCAKRQSCEERHFCTEGCFAQANETTRRLLESAPGEFGRLVLLSSLCDPSAEYYHHPAFDKGIPPCLVSLVLRCSHERLFAKWLDLPLEAQWKALSEYQATRQGAGERDTANQKHRVDTLVPSTARRPERELFYSDLELVLSLDGT